MRARYFITKNKMKFNIRQNSVFKYWAGLSLARQSWSMTIKMPIRVNIDRCYYSPQILNYVIIKYAQEKSLYRQKHVWIIFICTFFDNIHYYKNILSWMIIRLLFWYTSCYFPQCWTIWSQYIYSYTKKTYNWKICIFFHLQIVYIFFFN